ncbi:MAG: FliH/SctL family protein [Alphaproteobacteria bacterium]
MATVRKFMFEQSFDEFDDLSPAQQAKVAAEAEAKVVAAMEPEVFVPPPPTYSEAELAQAREESFATGRAEGLREASETIEQLTASALLSIAGSLTGLGNQQAKFNDETARNAVALALSVVRKILPDLARRHAFDEIATLVNKCLPEVLEQPRLIVRVTESAVVPLRERLGALADTHGFSGRLLVNPDEALNHGDCYIEWGEGGGQSGCGQALAQHRGDRDPECGVATTTTFADRAEFGTGTGTEETARTDSGREESHRSRRAVPGGFAIIVPDHLLGKNDG